MSLTFVSAAITGFSSPARRFLAVARLACLDGTVAGRGLDLHSSVPSTALAGSRDCFREPFPGMMGAVHLLYLMAQLEDSVRNVAQKRRGRLSRQVQGKSYGGLRLAHIIQSGVGRSDQSEDGVPRGERETVVMVDTLMFKSGSSVGRLGV